MTMQLPPGYLIHPQNPAYMYNPQTGEVLEAQAAVAPPVPPAPAPAPVAVPVPAPMPMAAPAPMVPAAQAVPSYGAVDVGAMGSGAAAVVVAATSACSPTLASADSSVSEPSS